MPNAPEPSAHGDTPDDGVTEEYPLVPNDTETETVVISKNEPDDDAEADLEDPQLERRFTAPGFDAKETTIIATTPEAATEVFATVPEQADPKRKREFLSKLLRHNQSGPAKREGCGARSNPSGAGYWR